MAKFTPSINIIRDENLEVNYIVTPNASSISSQISSDYKKGLRAFTLIGSYGSGKSTFLHEFDRGLRGKKNLEVALSGNFEKVESIRIVGQYQSLISHFEEILDIDKDFEGHQKIFDALYQKTRKTDLLVIYIDEFGKFLEYAAKHNPEKELYFFQLLAEFAGDTQKNILLLTTLHQNFEAYSSNSTESQRQEWKKVKGRLKEITFNEPIEQLLFLAAQKLNSTKCEVPSKARLARLKNLFTTSRIDFEELESQLAPLDFLSAAILTRALQAYGQNERSLFTYLETDLPNKEWVSLPDIYDSILFSFYTHLNSAYNIHYRNWQAFQAAVERVENSSIKFVEEASRITKVIALLQQFGSKASIIDEVMLIAYFHPIIDENIVREAIAELEKIGAIRFTRYNNSYKISEGTDVDFDQELLKAEANLDRTIDVANELNKHFSFPIVQAKANSYRTGTPRMFGFRISDRPLTKLKPENEIDGFINLVFGKQENLESYITEVKNHHSPTLFGFYSNAEDIEEHLFEIIKTQEALKRHTDDLVAKKEFEKIIESRKRILSHLVLDSLYTNKVKWHFLNSSSNTIRSQRELNATLSEICASVYPKTPIFNNELVNKHKPSSSINTARRQYFKQLCECWNSTDLAFSEDKFPPEKAIYRSLLLANGMHVKIKNSWELSSPHNENNFSPLWEASITFLQSAKLEKRPLSELFMSLSEKPFKLKQGFVDFWIPTFLFINRGDFALYEGEKFIPELNESILHLITRQPDKYLIKSFEIDELRLRVFNKYREVLQQGDGTLNSSDLIESIKPFMVFYKTLNDYSRRTETISQEAQALRECIIGAKDLENTFFQAIPKALDFRLDSNSDISDKELSEFAVKLNDAIQEIKNAYTNLLSRFESFLCNEIIGQNVSFSQYKRNLQSRLEGIKEHRLSPKQKVFVGRVNSPLNDRESWLASIAQAILNKPLDQIKDHEEEVLKDRMAKMIEDLASLRELHKVKTTQGEQALRVNIATEQGIKSQTIVIPKNKQQNVVQLSEEIRSLLKKHKGLELAVLSKLLDERLKND